MNVGHIIFTVVWCYIECKLNRKEKRTSVSWSGRQQTAPLRCLSDHTAGHVYIMLSCRSGFHSHYECIRFLCCCGFRPFKLNQFSEAALPSVGAPSTSLLPTPLSSWPRDVIALPYRPSPRHAVLWKWNQFVVTRRVGVVLAQYRK